MNTYRGSSTTSSTLGSRGSIRSLLSQTFERERERVTKRALDSGVVIVKEVGML